MRTSKVEAQTTPTIETNSENLRKQLDFDPGDQEGTQRLGQVVWYSGSLKMSTEELKKRVEPRPATFVPSFETEWAEFHGGPQRRWHRQADEDLRTGMAQRRVAPRVHAGLQRMLEHRTLADQGRDAHLTRGHARRTPHSHRLRRGDLLGR